MRDPWTTPERLALRESAAGFVRRHVVPHLAEWEEAGEVPRSLHREAATAGLLGIGFDQAVQLHGGMGYLRESEVERHYRDVRILGIGGGATEVLADLAGRLLGYSVGAR